MSNPIYAALSILTTPHSHLTLHPSPQPPTLTSIFLETGYMNTNSNSQNIVPLIGLFQYEKPQKSKSFMTHKKEFLDKYKVHWFSGRKEINFSSSPELGLLVIHSVQTQ